MFFHMYIFLKKNLKFLQIFPTHGIYHDKVHRPVVFLKLAELFEKTGLSPLLKTFEA
jgi:hypothetical protein